MKKFLIITLIFNILVCCISSCHSPKPKITINYKVKESNNNILKIDYILRNNDSVDYFVHLIKPAYKYTYLSYKDSSKWIQVGVDPDFLLAKKVITRSDLIETGEA